MGPVASSTDITLSITLLEPAIFLRGRRPVDPNKAKSAVVRGKLQVQTKRRVQVSRITVLLRGRAITYWPGGSYPSRLTPLDQADPVKESPNLTSSSQNRGCASAIIGHQSAKYVVHRSTRSTSHPQTRAPETTTCWTNARSLWNHKHGIMDSRTKTLTSSQWDLGLSILNLRLVAGCLKQRIPHTAR